jgi:hypothetical protein
MIRLERDLLHTATRHSSFSQTYWLVVIVTG